MDNEKQNKLFVKSMNEREIIAMNIAIEHLGTSFNLAKSNGFENFKKLIIKVNTNK